MIVLIAWMAALPSTAQAQTTATTKPKAPSTPDEAKSQAIALLKKGWAAYTGKRYGDALLHWTESVRLYPAAPTYMNMAEAHLKLDQFDAALAALQKARTSVLLPLDEAARAEAGKLELRIEQRRAELRQEREAEARRNAALDALSTTRVTTWTYVGGATAVAGLASLGAGFYFNNEARKLIDTMQPPQPYSREEYELRRRELERDQSRAITTTAVGTALVLVGTGLLVWDLSTVETPPPSTPAPSMSSAPRTSVGVGPSGASVRVEF